MAVAVLLAAFGVLVGLAVTWMQAAPQPLADYRSVPNPGHCRAYQAMSSEPAQAQTSNESAALFATDDEDSSTRMPGAKEATELPRSTEPSDRLL